MASIFDQFSNAANRVNAAATQGAQQAQLAREQETLARANPWEAIRSNDERMRMYGVADQMRQSGQDVYGQQQAQANQFQQRSMQNPAQAQSVFGGSAPPAPQVPQGPAPGGINPSQLYGTVQGLQGMAQGQYSPTSLQQMAGAAQALRGQQTGGPGNVQGFALPGQPGAVAGQLGGTPQAVGAGANVAGQLGAGPGNVYGTMGNMGGAAGDQQNMLGRLQGFLDQGTDPSIAQAQLQQAQANNAANLIGAARSARGGPGAVAAAMRGAISEGSAIGSDTAGQMATLRAQEADMQRQRQLQGIGLGGQLAGDIRAGDQAYRGQDIQQALADQSTQLGARGQDLNALLADQASGNQLALANLEAALAGRGQNLQALQGDQSSALGARGQDVNALLGQMQQNVVQRGQTLDTMSADAQRNLDAQGMNMQRELGMAGLGVQSQGQGLDYLSQAQQRGLMGEGAALDFYSQMAGLAQENLASQRNYAIGQQTNQQRDTASERDFWAQLIGGGLSAGGAVGAAALMPATSDETEKTDIEPLSRLKALADNPASEVLRKAPGYRYRYREGNVVGEDPSVPHIGPMAQDLEKTPVGRSLVLQGPHGKKMVNTSRLALVNHAALSGMRDELDVLRRYLEAG